MSVWAKANREARRWWSVAALCAVGAECLAWQPQASGRALWLWLILGVCALTFAWFWRALMLRPQATVPHEETQGEVGGDVDPALAAIREIWLQEGVPRIVVDAKHEGVLVPAHVRDRWGHQLVIDLDPRYPLRLEVTYEGCAVDLSFGGEVSRCIFAWPSIYTVQNRGSGAAVVIKARIPKDVATQS